jgi:hypothetical protein
VPSAENPLTGQCACGAVGFEVTAPFSTAGYCHCKRCQRRSGALWSANAIVSADGFAIVRGEEHVRVWTPPGEGLPKAFCSECSGQLYSDGGDFIVVRLGAVDGDPEVEFEWRQWLESAPAWAPIPDDGLRRFQQRRDG